MSLPIKFPYKLYAMLEYAADSEHASAVSWIDEGQAFAIHDKDTFLKHVVPRFFKQTKYHSFTRKLNFWGFHRTSWRGTVMMGWGHEHFVRGKVGDLQSIERVKIKSRKKAEHAKKIISPIAEPDVSPAASAFVTERRSTLSPSFASPAASFARPSRKSPPRKVVDTSVPQEKCDAPAAINIHDSGKDFNRASSAGMSACGAKHNASPSGDNSATRHGASPSDAKNDTEPPPEEEPAQMALPPGWKAAVDGGSGRVYYYRRQDLPSKGGSPPIFGTGGCPAPPAVSVDIVVPGPLREGAEATREGAKIPVPDSVTSSVPDVVTSFAAQEISGSP